MYKTFLGIEHPFGKLRNLLYGFVVVFFIPRQFSHLRQGRHTHEQIIEPERVGLRAIPGQRTIGQPEFFRLDVVDIIINEGPNIGFDTARPAGFDHGGTHGPGIVERVRCQYGPHGCVGLWGLPPPERENKEPARQ